MATAELIAAVAAGNIQAMNDILETDVDLDQGDEKGRTPLHHAAMNGQAAAGSLLIECGASVNALDLEDNTALHLAAQYNKRLPASMLLWGGVDRGAKNKKGDTALHVACTTGAPDVVYLIVENGGEETASWENDAGKTPLQLARENGNDECAGHIEAPDP
jgi:ankyrin repeat protein